MRHIPNQPEQPDQPDQPELPDQPEPNVDVDVNVARDPQPAGDETGDDEGQEEEQS